MEFSLACTVSTSYHSEQTERSDCVRIRDGAGAWVER
jgi:hypothetical protein